MSFTLLSLQATRTTLQDALTSLGLPLSIQNEARLTSCKRHGYVFPEHTGRETQVEENKFWQVIGKRIHPNWF